MMDHINNNVLAVFALLLMLFSILGQALIFSKTESVQPMPVTGKVSATGTIRFTIKYELSTINFSARLADDNRSVILEWSNYSADNYSVYATDNITRGFNYSDPLVNESTNLSYYDSQAGEYMQRYYQLGVWENYSERVLDTTVGKFNILLEASTLTPGVVELNSVSFPLLPTNATIANVLRNGRVNDVVSTYNTTRLPPAYDSVQKFDVGWFGQFSEFRPGRGYDFTIVTNRYNLSVVGEVPTGSYTAELRACSLTPGDIEMNSIGWSSVYTKCNLDVLLGNTSNDGDVISTYNPYRIPPAYDSIQKFPGGWFGQFSCFEPGKGYTFTIVGTGYNWTYDRGP
jgi:hypothetical protein